MKYGQSLSAFSVPEWRSHNILYDELKHEVKDLTQSDATFSKTGYFALIDSFRDEYASVNLFVSCKISEIEYRFQQCDQSIRELARSFRNSTSAAASVDDDDDGSTGESVGLTKQISSSSHSQHEEKIAELKRDISKLTQDIQNLSRFINAQFTGFRKLIKKYRRHAPREQLQKGRNLEEIDDLLVSKDSFAEVDLTPQFLELSVLYSVLRTRRFASYVKKPSRGSSIVDQLAEYDSEMVTSPSSDVYRFWIHPDNLMQVKVLLLQHMDLLAPPEVQQELAQRLKPNGPVKISNHANNTWHSEIMPEEYTTALYMDTEELQSARNLKEPAQVREVMVGREHSTPFLLAPMGGTRHPAVMTLTRSQVQAIQEERHEDFRKLLKSNDSTKEGSGNVGAQLAVRWAFSHRVKPVVTLSMHRTRFRNSGSGSDRIWATIDSHATIEHDHSGQTPSAPGERIMFPYSVLEVRTRTHSHWVDTLRQSHLVHPVSASFSLYGWALLTTRPQQVLVRPSWLDVLDSGADIRRDPQKLDPLPRLKSQKSMANLKLVGGRSGSNRFQDSEEEEGRPAHRYWNEFDDGDEYQDTNEHFFDEIDAELQRARVAARLAQPVYSIGDGVRRHLHMWFDRAAHPYRNSNDVEAVGDAASFHSLDTQSTSSLEPVAVSGSESGQYSPRVGNSRRFSRDRSEHSATYGACDYPFSKDEMRRQQSDPGLTFYTSVMFSSSAAIVLLVYYVLFTEEMSSISIGFRLFLVLALTVSLCLALAGYVINSFRSGSSWTSQIIVHTVLLTIVCFGVGGAANIAIPPV